MGSSSSRSASEDPTNVLGAGGPDGTAAAIERAGADPLQRRRRDDVNRALTLAKWTDQRYLDPLVGLLLPGVGDVLGALAGLYIVQIAVRHQAPRGLVARMLFNLSIDCVGGLVPVAGDVFDALNRANVRNARLLQQHLFGEGDRGSTFSSRGRSLTLAVAGFIIALGAALAFIYFVGRHRFWR